MRLFVVQTSKSQDDEGTMCLDCSLTRYLGTRVLALAETIVCCHPEQVMSEFGKLMCSQIFNEDPVEEGVVGDYSWVC